MSFPLLIGTARKTALLAACWLFLNPPLPAFCITTPPTTRELPARWTLVEAVAFALDNSPDAEVAKQRIMGAAAAIDQARAALYPTLGLSLEYGLTNNPMYSFGNILNQGSFVPSIDFNDPGTTDNLQLAAGLNYRVYNGGRDQAGLRAARAGRQAEEYRQQAVLSRLGFEVVRSFYTIVQAGEIVSARESAVTAITSSLEVARARFAAGDLLRTNLLDMEVQQAASRERLIEARHGLELARRSFLNLLGLEQQEVDIDAAQQFPQQVPDNPDGSARPELHSLEATIAVLEEKLRQARAGYLPTADLYGRYQFDQGFEYENNNGNSWMAGVRLSYSLYEGRRTSAAVAAGTAALAGAREQHRKTRLSVGLEIEQAKLALHQADERLQVTEKMLELARESARLSRERFREGVILSSTLMDAENRLTDARVHHSLAKANRAIAVADLRRAAGLPQFEEITGK